MAKIGTAHIEIKPVLNKEALAAIVQQIEDAVARGVERALEAADRKAEDASRKQFAAWRNGAKVVVNNGATDSD